MGDEQLEHDADVEIIDVSEYEPKRIPSKTWRECIKSVRLDSEKIWEVDPLECPKCGGEMKIISFITEASVVGMSWHDLKQTMKQEVPANIKACLLRRQALLQILS